MFGHYRCPLSYSLMVTILWRGGRGRTSSLLSLVPFQDSASVGAVRFSCERTRISSKDMREVSLLSPSFHEGIGCIFLGHVFKTRRDRPVWLMIKSFLTRFLILSSPSRLGPHTTTSSSWQLVRRASLGVKMSTIKFLRYSRENVCSLQIVLYVD